MYILNVITDNVIPLIFYCGTQYMKPVLPPPPPPTPTPPHPHPPHPPLKIRNWIFSFSLNFYHYIVLN
jgi:hypothetical protein